MMLNFNPRSHEESDKGVVNGLSDVVIFQSPLSRRERPACSSSQSRYLLFQSTLSRRERPDLRRADYAAFVISIHALTKRATSYPFKSCQIAKNFNPRSHEESDVNIRTDLSYQQDFNPRSHEESDHNQLHSKTTTHRFQSTLSRRERPQYIVYCG